MTIMAEDRDSPKDIAPRFKYAIFSQPRTGSQALADFLTARQFGAPVEFINTRFIQPYCRNRGLANVGLHDYLNFLFRRRSSPNGVFGIKVQVNQFAAIAQQGKQDSAAIAQDIMGRFDKVIVLKRRNKLNQTSSYYRALTTDTRSPAQGPGGDEDIMLDVSRFATLLATIIAWDSQMDRIVREVGADAMALDYEDLTGDAAASLNRVVEFLGMDTSDGPLALPGGGQMPRPAVNRDLETQCLEATGATSG